MLYNSFPVVCLLFAFFLPVASVSSYQSVLYGYTRQQPWTSKHCAPSCPGLPQTALHCLERYGSVLPPSHLQRPRPRSSCCIGPADRKFESSGVVARYLALLRDSDAWPRSPSNRRLLPSGGLGQEMVDRALRHSGHRKCLVVHLR